MLLQRTRILPNERQDLVDYNRIEDFACADLKAIFKNVFSNQNFVFSGFASTGVGTNTLSIALANSTFITGQNDGTLYIGAPSLANLTTTSLSPGTTNYIELFASQDTGGADSRAFWDQTAAGGAGAEFSQIIDTFIFLKADIKISTANFSGDPDKVRICEVDVNGSGVITAIRDARNLFWRLGRSTNPLFSYPWASRTEPPTTQFNGADKDIKDLKSWADAVMTSFKELKESTYWFEATTVTIPGSFKNAAFSTITPLTSGARVEWDGSNLSFTDDALNPSLADAIAAIRIFDSTLNLRLLRQDDGKEVQKITFSAVPDAGAFVLEHNGDTSASIPYTANAATVLAAWNGSITAQLESVTGDFEKGFVLKFAVLGPQVQLTVSTNSLTKSAIAVTITPTTIKNGYVGASPIAIGMDQVLWVEIPNPMANVDYSGTGVIASNYRISSRGSVPLDGTTYWLAYREGARLIFRGVGELAAGESSQIGDNVPESLLNIIGIATEATYPAYSSDVRGTVAESLVSRLGHLTDAIGDEQENRSGYLRSDNQVTWTGTELQFATDIILEFINTKAAGAPTQHIVQLANSPVALANNESMWVRVNRSIATENLVVHKTTIDPLPAQSQLDKDVFVIAHRKDVGAVQYLHIPFMKSVMAPGQSIRLGQSGSGSGITKVTLRDLTSTTLPTGPTYTADGVAAVDGDTVLFTNLSLNNNQVYQISGVGVSIVWTPVAAFGGFQTPSDGDLVVVSKGNSFNNAIGNFVDTAWQFNFTVRHFNGADYFEQSALITSTLNNNTTGNVFSVTAAGSENWVIEFSLLRNGLKETGTLYITHDGTNAYIAADSAFSGATGVAFFADISAGNLRLRYTTTNSGFSATMKYATRRWSDSAGGPNGIPSYTPFFGAPPSAAFAMSDGSGTEINCSAPFNVLGKTRVQMSFTYQTGINSGTTVGQLEVYVNGQRYPRFVSGATLDGYYKEIANDTIEFNTDLTVSPLSIEIIKR